MAIGDITGVIASLEFDTSKGWYSNIIHVAGNVYAISYQGPDNHGWLKTVEIQSNGTITREIDSFEFDTTRGVYPNMIHIDGDVYAIAYYGPDYYGWLKTVEIQSNGTITGEIASFEFDPDHGVYPNIIHISGDVYAIAYRGPDDDGWLKTVGIQSNGTITTPELASFEFDTDWGFDPDMIHISGDVYAIAYEGSGEVGWLKTVEILSNGTITTPELASFQFGTWWFPSPHIIGVGDDAYAIVYMGNYDHCWLQTVEILSDGTITGMIGSLDVDSSSGTVTPWMTHVAGDTYALTYGGPDDDGWLKTVGIETPAAAAAATRSRFTGGFPHRPIH